jgi:hypothetical protein
MLVSSHVLCAQVSIVLLLKQRAAHVVGVDGTIWDEWWKELMMMVKPIFLNFDEKSDMRDVMFRLVPNGLGEPGLAGGWSDGF